MWYYLLGSTDLKSITKIVKKDRRERLWQFVVKLGCIKCDCFLDSKGQSLRSSLNCVLGQPSWWGARSEENFNHELFISKGKSFGPEIAKVLALISCACGSLEKGPLASKEKP